MLATFFLAACVPTAPHTQPRSTHAPATVFTRSDLLRDGCGKHGTETAHDDVVIMVTDPLQLLDPNDPKNLKPKKYPFWPKIRGYRVWCSDGVHVLSTKP